jgi:hypothetical protein
VVAVTFEEAGPRVELYRGAFDGEGKPGLW